MLTGRGIQAVSKMATGKAWASLSGLTGSPTTETGFIPKDTARGSMLIKVDIFTEGSSSTGTEKEKVLSSTPMETAIKGTGRMVNSMEKVSLPLQARGN